MTVSTIHSCERCLEGRTSLRCENKYRLSVYQSRQVEKSAYACKISQFGVPCGMPAQFELDGETLKVVCDGYCGLKHKNMAESGSWRGTLLVILQKELEALQLKEEQLKTRIAEVTQQHDLVMAETAAVLRPDSPPKAMVTTNSRVKYVRRKPAPRM
ncbi:18-kDa cys-rich protein [Sorghum chlorotic spot virus]|uniref:18-kDa cys-rich protein n=1 Tax=Sorghum chlorotic spot virus TaxID=107804 RepID=Q9JGJ2_9VIRU|nr:18-kDa cys-rich protein [Sorghum chlorotic spot virus]BAA94807.1 18-kDa cys-rich protein [Sorghum chlorotic spot virus]